MLNADFAAWYDLDSLLEIQGEHSNRYDRRELSSIVEFAPDAIVKVWKTGVLYDSTLGFCIFDDTPTTTRVVGWCAKTEFEFVKVLTKAIEFRHSVYPFRRRAMYTLLVKDTDDERQKILKSLSWQALKVQRRPEPERDLYLFYRRYDEAASQ